MLMATIGQYSCTFHSLLADKVYENNGEGDVRELFDAWNSIIQLVMPRLIDLIHCSSRLDPRTRIKIFDASRDLELAS